jgi:nitroreductase
MTKPMANAEVLRDAVQLACRAPSIHNSQPWRWVAAKNTVFLFGDPRRVMRSADSSGREAIISCGAALDHFRVAMVAAGWRTTMERFPNPNRRDHLASVEFAPTEYVTKAQRERADAILRRRTDRLAFDAPENWESFEPVLRTTFDSASARLDVLTDDVRPTLAEASRLTESERRYDEYYQDELQWWTAPFRLFEGVPPSALASESEQQHVDVNRQFPVYEDSHRRAATKQDQAKILLLSTPEDTRLDALSCGEVLSTVLLECTMAGMATCTLTHLTELEASRAIIGDLIGNQGMPQVLIRVGTAPPMEVAPPPTPRRPLEEVLEFRSPAT